MINLRQAINKKIKLWDEAIASATHEKVALKLLRDKKRWLCRNDLYYLCCLVGCDEIKKYPEVYQPFCDEVSLMNWNVLRLGIHKENEDLLKIEEVTDNPDLDLKDVERLYLCHRVFYKTTIVTKVHSLQLLLNFPNLHIVLAHNKQENSSDNLVTVKNFFLTPELSRLFPEFIPEGKEWGNMSGFSVANRTDKGRTEENIEAIGIETEITGRHWDIAKKNDLVTEKSVWTEEQIKKTWDWDARFNVGHFTDPERKLQDYEGTRYHFADLYSVKLNNPKIKIISYPLLKDQNPENLSIENIQNPKRFTPDGIKDLQSDMWTFMCQHLLKPEDPAKMQFKSGMIQYWDSIPNCNFYLFVDPASARKKKSDYTSMLIVGLDSDGKRYIVDGLRDKLDTKQRIDEALALAVKWAIKGCGWEAIAFQTTDIYYLEEERRKRKLFFNIEEIKSHQMSKEDRIKSLIPEYSNHLWLWPKKGEVTKKSYFDGKMYDLTEKMEYEFMQFPLGEHDDLMDTMTFFNRINIVKPRKDIPIESKGMTFGEYAKIREDRVNDFNRNPWNKLYVN